MKKRQLFPYKPDTTRLAPESEYAALNEAARRAHAAVGDKRASVAVIICRPLADGSGVSIHSGMMLGHEATASFLLEHGPANLAEYVERQFTPKEEKPS